MTARIPEASSVDRKAQPDPMKDSWTEVLRGGDKVRIRAIHPHDADMERRFIEELSPTSRRFRFMATMSSPSEALLKQLTEFDPETEAAYVAEIDDGTEDHEVGVARFSTHAGGQDCEFAITVSDKWQNRGLGTHLMHYLTLSMHMPGASFARSESVGNSVTATRTFGSLS